MPSQVIQSSLSSRLIGGEWPYAVYLPEGETQSLPIMYLLHGASHQCPVWFQSGNMQHHFDEAIAAGIIPPLIAITPASLDEGFSWYVDHLGCPIESAFISDFISSFETLYGGPRTKETRWIGGSSMGAYGALRYVLKHPALFSRIIMVAPALWDSIANRSISEEHPPHRVFRAFLSDGKVDDALWQSNLYPRLMETFLKEKSPVIFYTSAGDRDSMGLEFYAAKLHRFLREQRQRTTLRIWDGDHGDWDYYPLALIDGISHTTKQRP